MTSNRNQQARDAAIEYAQRELSIAIGARQFYEFEHGKRDPFYKWNVENKQSALRFARERQY